MFLTLHQETNEEKNMDIFTEQEKKWLNFYLKNIKAIFLEKYKLFFFLTALYRKLELYTSSCGLGTFACVLLVPFRC